MFIWRESTLSGKNMDDLTQLIEGSNGAWDILTRITRTHPLHHAVGAGKFRNVGWIKGCACLACLELARHFRPRLGYLTNELSVHLGFDETVVLAVLPLALKCCERQAAGTGPVAQRWTT